MARLPESTSPMEKRIEIALTYIFGVGRTRARGNACHNRY